MIRYLDKYWHVLEDASLLDGVTAVLAPVQKITLSMFGSRKEHRPVLGSAITKFVFLNEILHGMHVQNALVHGNLYRRKWTKDHFVSFRG